jgi:hypothetical protein
MMRIGDRKNQGYVDLDDFMVLMEKGSLYQKNAEEEKERINLLEEYFGD